MPADEDIPLPRVPDADATPAFISTPDMEEAIPNLATVLAGPEEIDAGSFLFSPGVAPASVFGYALGGEETLTDIEEIVRSRANVTDRGKVSKYDVFYSPQTPIPFGVWEYKCETCRFYQSDEETFGDGPKCEVVGHEEDWMGGENVHPQGWCATWLPEQGRGWFEYATDRLEGVDGSA
jgi:hypothetical protein